MALLGAHRPSLEEALTEFGALLLRGFNPLSAVEFESLARAFSGELMGYTDRATRRSTVVGHVLTATDTPPHYPIALHNEMAFASALPRRVFFCCQQPAESGGSTPLADVRRVYERLGQEVRLRFEQRGVRYLRCFGGGPGMGWQDTFQVCDRRELELQLTRETIDFRWLEDGRLQTSQTRPAVAYHPRTGIPAWVNHAAVLHVSAVPEELRDILLSQYTVEELPHHTTDGNGEAIVEDDLAEIRRCYAMETRTFFWQPSDVLILDNLSVAHGREPYRGQRTVQAVLADPIRWDELSSSAWISL